MEKRMLGSQGLTVSALGLGCMGMSDFYGTRDDARSLETIARALDLGVTLLDTAPMYGPFINEELVGRAIRGRRERAVIATKFGVERGPGDPNARRLDSRPETVRSSCEDSLRRLGVERVDLFYQQRLDPQVPIEETVGAMADLVRGARLLTSACARSARKRWRERTQCIRSRQCSPSTRCSIASPSRTFFLRCASSA